MHVSFLSTRLGLMRASWTAVGLTRLEFTADDALFEGTPLADIPISLRDAILAAVDGDGPENLVPLDLQGSDFQREVWDQLRRIPRGTTTTYGALARSLGLGAGSSRAVGTACAANRIAILIPCHRVVPASGGLGGYRWGIERKRHLLESEGASRAVPRETLPFGEDVQVARPR